MKVPHPDQWKYQGFAESLVQTIRRNGLTDEQLEDLLLHVFGKIYELGQNDFIVANKYIAIGLKMANPVVPVTDLSDIPEVFEHAKNRWRNGLCH